MALINIASDKQLFVDTYLIESLKDARQVMNPAKKPPRSLAGWEGDYVGVSDVWLTRSSRCFTALPRTGPT